VKADQEEEEKLQGVGGVSRVVNQFQSTEEVMGERIGE